MEHIEYRGQDRQVTWEGISLSDGDGFESFMADEVAARLHDEEASQELRACLRGLTSTGFAEESLEEILSADTPEERDWAVGEAMAEAYLVRQHNVVWPWNMERDKRTPKASLPGADLVGFEINGDNVRLVLGEVKTSSDIDSPPGVMNGRGGMTHQIDRLANNLSLILQLLKWLYPRCKRTEHEPNFKSAMALFLSTGNKAVALFGVLIRGTEPNENDLRARGTAIACTLEEPSTCQLIALHPPCQIADLPALAMGGES